MTTFYHFALKVETDWATRIVESIWDTKNVSMYIMYGSFFPDVKY